MIQYSVRECQIIISIGGNSLDLCIEERDMTFSGFEYVDSFVCFYKRDMHMSCQASLFVDSKFACSSDNIVIRL